MLDVAFHVLFSASGIRPGAFTFAYIPCGAITQSFLTNEYVCIQNRMLFRKLCTGIIRKPITCLRAPPTQYTISQKR